MPTNEETIKEALVNVMGCLVSSYDDERRQDPQWEKLFKKTDGVNFKPLLREAEHQMMTIALDTYDLIEKELAKVGKKPPKHAFDIIKALPYVINSMEELATKNEYSACCVDKAFYITNKVLNPDIAPEAAEGDCNADR